MGSKTVWYAGGALGALLAAGLLAQPATAAAGAPASLASTGETVSSRQAVPAEADCTGHVLHQINQDGIKLKFWSSANGSNICIGTIELTATQADSVEVYGEHTGIPHFCDAQASGTSVTKGCHTSKPADVAVVGVRHYQGKTYSVTLNA